MGRMRSLALLAALSWAVSAAAHLPAQALDYAPTLRLHASAPLRLFGIHLYDAELWVSGERYVPQQAHALSLRYRRAIDAARLVDTSIDEMRRLGAADETRLARWRQELARALPSVQADERIVGLHLPGCGAVFWHQGRLTAEIQDPELAHHFFAIWLDERTRKPALRVRLLGEVAR